MSHFAVVAPPYPSHFKALQALARTLLQRGHHVTFFHQCDSQRWLDDARIAFCPVGLDERPAGSLDQALQLAANPSNPWRLRRLIRQLAETSALLCAQLPAALQQQRIDAVLSDQMEPAGALVAEAHHHLGLALSRRAGVSAIAAALAHLLEQPMPGLAPLQAELAQGGGVGLAADIIETAVRTGQPVLAQALL